MLLAFAPEAERRDEALTSARRGFELNPNDMSPLLILAFVEALLGHTAGALEHLKQAMRISPRDPMRYGMCNQFAMTCSSPAGTRRGRSMRRWGSRGADSWHASWVVGHELRRPRRSAQSPRGPCRGKEVRTGMGGEADGGRFHVSRQGTIRSSQRLPSNCSRFGKLRP